MQRVPTLVGIAGHFKGQLYALEYGKPILVGRSRMVAVSLRRTPTYRQMSEAECEKNEAAKTVSGRHFQVTMFNLSSIEIKNLSPNGTRMDGKPVDTALITDVTTKVHHLEFGLDEVLALEMRDKPPDA